MDTLNHANPFFVRCIKSNAEKVISLCVYSSVAEFDVIESCDRQLVCSYFFIYNFDTCCEVSRY